MSALQRFDFTLKAEDVPSQTVCEVLREWCNKWVVQLERGEESGYLHYQGRFNMYKPKRLTQVVDIFTQRLPGIYISITSNACKSFDYVLKADTRIDGPWSDQTPVKVLTPQLSDFLEMELRPWQKEVVTLCSIVDYRSIHVILDEIGNSGKSILAEYLEYQGLAYELPMMNCMEDIMQCAMSIEPQKCYLVDMPKGLKKEKLAAFYGGLECLKNGVMYDKRYAFKKRRIARPQIIVFTNAMPDFNLLSRDRWHVHRLTALWNLVDIDIEEVGGHPNGGTPGASL